MRVQFPLAAVIPVIHNARLRPALHGSMCIVVIETPTSVLFPRASAIVKHWIVDTRTREGFRPLSSKGRGGYPVSAAGGRVENLERDDAGRNQSAKADPEEGFVSAKKRNAWPVRERTRST